MTVCGAKTVRHTQCRKPRATCPYHGGGLLPEPCKGAPPAVRKWLKEHGAERVLALWVGREPVNELVQRVLDVITKGRLTEAKRRLQYEQLFHTWLEVQLSGGGIYRLEKNEVVEVKLLSPAALDKDERMRVPVVWQLTAADMLEHAELLQGVDGGRGDFWGYDHARNNCQLFVSDVLAANPALKKSDELTAFYRQNAEAIDQELGEVASRLGRNATKLAARIHRVRFGAGLRPSLCPRSAV